MNDGNGPFGTDSRRSLLKKGVLTATALTLGATGSAAAQQEGDGGGTETTPGGGSGATQALVQSSNFHPNARFTFVSGVVDWTPDVPAVSDDVLASYSTYMIRWLNTNEIVSLWVRDDGVIAGFDEAQGFVPSEEDPDRPELYQMSVTGQPSRESGHLVSVTIEPVPASEADAILANDRWWQDGRGGGATPAGTPTGTGTPISGTETPTENASGS